MVIDCSPCIVGMICVTVLIVSFLKWRYKAN